MKTIITKDELAALPLRSYGGPICLVSKPDDLERAREDFRQERIVGLDTESPPTFRAGQSSLPALIQVAVSRTVYLFRLEHQSLPDSSRVITELFEDPEIIKAGIGLADDFRSLKQRFPFKEKNTADLAAAARKHGMEQTGIRNLAGIFLGFRVSKAQKVTNWGRRELTQPQILYAATDAWVCRELYRSFQEKGFIE